jgi:hypothetical protein
MFDILNRLVHETDAPKQQISKGLLDGHAVSVKAVEVEDAYLIFATVLEDEALEEIFVGLKIIH